MADGSLEVVGAAHAQVMAGIAGNEAGFGQTRIKIEFLAEFRLGQVDLLRRLDGLDRLVGNGGTNRDGNGQGRDERMNLHYLTP
jgi:hypothetical protein